MTRGYRRGIEASRLIALARRGSGLTQRELAAQAGTSQAAVSEYERGLKTPNLAAAERIIEAAGYPLDLVTEVRFTEHRAPGLPPFGVLDRLWRARTLPECFAKVVLDDATRYGVVKSFDLRRRAQRKQLYELVLRRGRRRLLRPRAAESLWWPPRIRREQGSRARAGPRVRVVPLTRSPRDSPRRVDCRADLFGQPVVDLLGGAHHCGVVGRGDFGCRAARDQVFGPLTVDGEAGRARCATKVQPNGR